MFVYIYSISITFVLNIHVYITTTVPAWYSLHSNVVIVNEIVDTIIY